MAQETWFTVITRPRSHLAATIVVWSWFPVALIGAAVNPELAIWFEGSAATSVIGWYVTMMRLYRAARRPSREAERGEV